MAVVYQGGDVLTIVLNGLCVEWDARYDPTLTRLAVWFVVQRSRRPGRGLDHT